jgi:glycosyltransferase involved in cell wall biosynthesis
MPKVSVIVPFFEVVEKHFRDCLDSLCSQTMQDTEFLLVSDGASSKNTSICDEYIKNDHRFRLLTKEHSGVSATRNLGIKQALGEYIVFVDADDTLYNNRSLERCYESVQKNHSDIILFDWITKGKDPLSLWPEDKTILSDTEKEECLKQLISMENPAFSGAPWAKLYNRTFLTKKNILFNPKCIIGEDLVFNYEAFYKASKISYTKEIIYIYVMHKESTIQRYRPNCLPVFLNHIEELKKLSNEKYLSLIGKESLKMLYFSWHRCYMHPKNKETYFNRMKELSNIILSNRFQELIQSVDTTNRNLLFKVETWLFQHKITFPIWLHGFKFNIINLFKRA